MDMSLRKLQEVVKERGAVQGVTESQIRWATEQRQQDICPVVEFLGHTIVLFLVFQGKSLPFCIVAVLISIPTDSARGSRLVLCGDV